ncbi:unnamed protein product [Boreogadus saida]
MPLYSDISGTETGKCTDCTKLQQTVASFETRLAALEKCKGLQDTVPMGEFAELTQIQHDDQSYIVSFPKLDKRETVSAASHWHRVGAKPKQHTKVNQQVHSTPLKLTLPLKNRFLPLQESTNAPATHAPLSPEMRPDRQCGQRRSNQSPRRRAVHVSATVQQGPIAEKADEPDTLIIGDSTIKEITVRAQVEKKRDYSLPDTSTLPLSDTQIADSPQTLKIDNSPPDAIDTVPSPIADAGLARNGHPPPWSDAQATIKAQVEKKTLKRDNSPPDAINTVPSPIDDAGLARNGHPPPTLPLSATQIADSPQTLPWSDAQATIRAQVEKKACISRISKALKLTLPLKNRFLPLQESTNAPATHAPDAFNTVLRGVADLARNDHPPLHYYDDLQPHLSHSYLSSPNVSSLCGDLQPHLSNSYLSSPNVSSLCDFPAEYKRLEYDGSQFISGSLIASPCHGDRLITPKRMAPQPPHYTDSSHEYY